MVLGSDAIVNVFSEDLMNGEVYELRFGVLVISGFTESIVPLLTNWELEEVYRGLLEFY